jgi:diguanylate cyclase (GGDEF)-like protein
MSEDSGPASSGLVTELIADLATSSSGISFVYRTLDTLADRLGLQDAVLLIDDPRAGRQVFRKGRGDPRGATALIDPLEAAPGLHLDPPHDAEQLSGVAELCRLGLELDLRRHDASHDPLTGLQNRRSFDELFSQATSQSRRYGWPFALVLIDLDGFKQVNDRHGHAEGDRLLRLFGGFLRAAMRSGDFAARIGGDEFALLVANAGQEAAETLTERVRRSMEDVDDNGVGFSHGISLAPAEANEQESLYEIADGRLYAMKAARRAAR